jgi:hypothetical protein
MGLLRSGWVMGKASARGRRAGSEDRATLGGRRASLQAARGWLPRPTSSNSKPRARAQAALTRAAPKRSARRNSFLGLAQRAQGNTPLSSMRTNCSAAGPTWAAWRVHAAGSRIA